MQITFLPFISKPKRSRSLTCFCVLALAGVVSAAAADLPRISEDEAKKSVVARAAPITPPIAKQAHISGRVVCELTVAEDGSVEKVDVASGNPILGAAASKAAKNWMFKPFLGADGKAGKALVQLSFQF